jgi:hypothetical protein
MSHPSAYEALDYFGFLAQGLGLKTHRIRFEVFVGYNCSPYLKPLMFGVLIPIS